MTTKNIIILFLCFIVATSFCYGVTNRDRKELIVKNAAMPSVTRDENGAIHIVFANGNMLECVTSVNNGASFSSPFLVDTINGLFGVAGRGPQIISTIHTLTILAPDKSGNIYAYTKHENGNWIKNGRVNDVPDVCKEGFLSVCAKGTNLYAIWLDLRGMAGIKLQKPRLLMAAKHGQKIRSSINHLMVAYVNVVNLLLHFQKKV